LNFGVIMYQTSRSKGQELVARRMTEELIAQGHRAYLITSRFDDSTPVVSRAELQRRGGVVQGVERGIPVVRVASSRVEWPPRRVNFVNFVAILDRLVDELKLDVLITHSTLWNGPELVARFVSWRRRLGREGIPGRIPLFCHMSHYQPPLPDRYSERERTYREVWNEDELTLIVREADVILVTTPFVGDEMVELGARREQCLLFPGGVIVPEARTLKEVSRFRAERGLGDAKLVTFLGTFEERKNPAAVLRVAEKLRNRSDVRFVLAGRLEGAYGSMVLRRASRLPNVSVLGELPDDDKSTLIRASYLNITMSRLEALGLAQLEFMSGRVPVITSGVGGQSWIVHHGRTGILLRGPDDLQGAADAVESLLDDGRKRDRMATEAEMFASGLSMESLTRSLVSRLEELRLSAGVSRGAGGRRELAARRPSKGRSSHQ
jgi:D-inositol-3-phosphate glycosyltransferase